MVDRTVTVHPGPLVRLLPARVLADRRPLLPAPILLPSALLACLALSPRAAGVGSVPAEVLGRVGWTPPADTTEWSRRGLGAIPEAVLLARGRWLFHAGYSTPPGGGTEGGGGGSANQTNIGEIGWGVGERLTLLLGMEVNDDPTFAAVRGERRDRSFVTLALAARTDLLSRPGDGALSIGAQGSLQLLRMRSDPGLFNAGDTSAVTTVPLAALDLPATVSRGRWTLSLVPSLAFLPRDVLGAPFYGPTVRIGGRGEVEAGAGWSFWAAGELPLGPGENVLERDGELRRLPTWRVGTRYQATPRVVLAGAVTNRAGATPATRHLTLPSTPTTLYEVGIWYSPVEEAPAPATGGASEMHGAPGTGGHPAVEEGVAVPGAATVPRGRGVAAVAIDSEGALLLSVTHALGRDVAFELMTTRQRGVDPGEGLGAGIGEGFQYRFGVRVAFARQGAGRPFSLGGRVTVGRDVDDQQGYLLAEAVILRRLGVLRLVLNPVVVQSAERSPTSLGVGGALRAGPVQLLVEGRASFSGEAPVWTAGLRSPRFLGRVAADLFFSTAASPWELGRLLPDPRGVRVGTIVRVAF